LVDFCLKVLNTEPDSYLENSSIVLLEFKEKFNSIIDEADNISNLLRNDLHIEKLNVSLYRRLN
jgi:hypothetical protein